MLVPALLKHFPQCFMIAPAEEDDDPVPDYDKLNKFIFTDATKEELQRFGPSVQSGYQSVVKSQTGKLSTIIVSVTAFSAATV